MKFQSILFLTMLVSESQQIAVKSDVYPFNDPSECCPCAPNQKVIHDREETAKTLVQMKSQTEWRQGTNDYYPNQNCCACAKYSGEGLHPFYEKVGKSYGWADSFSGTLPQEYTNKFAPEYTEGDHKWSALK